MARLVTRPLSIDRPQPAARRNPLPFPVPPPPLVELTGVTKVFRTARHQVVAVDEVNLAVRPGSAVLVRGPSGSGKSTLLKLVGCMLRPTAGRIRVDGRDVAGLSEDQRARLRRQQFGFVFQRDHLVEWASALDNVLLPLLPQDDGNGQRERAEALLESLGVARLRHRPVRDLSGGERQRVAIARALVGDPRIVLADEPTAYLDERRRRDLVGVLASMQDDGRTLILASHDPELCTARGLPFRWDAVLDLGAQDSR